MPPGFPKGQQRFTTAKVIVARSFAAEDRRDGAERTACVQRGRQLSWDARRRDRRRERSILRPTAAASRELLRARTSATTRSSSRRTTGLSPNANSPAIVAAIEAAVADGMDVINFSGGEPEIEPSRDIVALALDAAAAAGVVPVIAAGNDYSDFGAGSVSSPANSERAITVGAVEITGTTKSSMPASRRSGRRRSRSVSSRTSPRRESTCSRRSPGRLGRRSRGRAWPSPHVAGAAALLRQRHPAWTVEQLKSALVQTGVDAVDERGRAAGPRFQGGGVVALQRADRPLLFAKPTAVSFGLMARGQDETQTRGPRGRRWRCRDVERRPRRLQRLRRQGREADASTDRDRAGRAQRLCLRRTQLGARGPGRIHRASAWSEVRRESRSGLASPPPLSHGTRRRPSGSRGSTAAATLGAKLLRDALPLSGEPARRRRHDGASRARSASFRLRLTGPRRTSASSITSRGRGSRVEPRVVAGLDENRLTGYAGLPVNHNPYMEEFRAPTLAAGALSPIPGEYGVVFDSAARAGAGSFRFRYWVNDVTPPTLRLANSLGRRATSRFVLRPATPAQGCIRSRSSRSSTVRRSTR